LNNIVLFLFLQCVFPLGAKNINWDEMFISRQPQAPPPPKKKRCTNENGQYDFSSANKSNPLLSQTLKFDRSSGAHMGKTKGNVSQNGNVLNYLDNDSLKTGYSKYISNAAWQSVQQIDQSIFTKTSPQLPVAAVVERGPSINQPVCTTNNTMVSSRNKTSLLNSATTPNDMVSTTFQTIPLLHDTNESITNGGNVMCTLTSSPSRAIVSRASVVPSVSEMTPCYVPRDDITNGHVCSVDVATSASSEFPSYKQLATKRNGIHLLKSGDRSPSTYGLLSCSKELDEVHSSEDVPSIAQSPELSNRLRPVHCPSHQHRSQELLISIKSTVQETLSELVQAIENSSSTCTTEPNAIARPIVSLDESDNPQSNDPQSPSRSSTRAMNNRVKHVTTVTPLSFKPPAIGCESHAVSPASSIVTSSTLLQWENVDALCWFHVVLCLVTHNGVIRRITNGMGEDVSILKRLVTEFDHAQRLHRQCVELRRCQWLCGIGRTVKLETSCGKFCCNRIRIVLFT